MCVWGVCAAQTPRPGVAHNLWKEQLDVVHRLRASSSNNLFYVKGQEEMLRVFMCVLWGTRGASLFSEEQRLEEVRGVYVSFSSLFGEKEMEAMLHVCVCVCGFEGRGRHIYFLLIQVVNEGVGMG